MWFHLLFIFASTGPWSVKVAAAGPTPAPEFQLTAVTGAKEVEPESGLNGAGAVSGILGDADGPADAGGAGARQEAPEQSVAGEEVSTAQVPGQAGEAEAGGGGEAGDGGVDLPAPIDAPEDAAEDAAGDPAGDDELEIPAWQARYHSPREGGELLAAWATAHPMRARVVPWARSAAGAELVALEFASQPLPDPAPTDPAPTDPASTDPAPTDSTSTDSTRADGASGTSLQHGRPRIYLIGGLDGRSLAGAEAVLRVTGSLLERLADLPPEFVFVAVPFAGQDGLERLRLGQDDSGANGQARDDDGDGQMDEDGPDDLDGDGRISSMLVADAAGPWVLSADERFLRPARPGEGPRYVLLPEGRDDDGDGLFNEDGSGGLRPDLNFPLGWDGIRGHPLAGELPLQAPESRALVHRLLDGTGANSAASPVAAVLLFSGEHGGIAFPGGMQPTPWPAGAEAALWARLTRDFAASTGRALLSPLGQLPLGGTLAELCGEPRPGAALDWIYGVAGVLAMELSPWGPRMLVAGGGRPLPGNLGGFSTEGAGDETMPVTEDRAWAHWLDNVRGGIGFIDWHPVELGTGGGEARVLVGGWEPRTRLNPPADELDEATANLAEFVFGLAEDLPRLAIEITGVERRGEWVRLAARMENKGELPARLWPTGRWNGAAADSKEAQIPGVKPAATGLAGHGLRTADSATDDQAALDSAATGSVERGLSGADLPTTNGVTVGERALTSAPVALELVLPLGVELLAGSERVLVESLPGGSRTPEAVWLLRAAPGSVFTLRASAPGCRTVERDVRP